MELPIVQLSCKHVHLMKLLRLNAQIVMLIYCIIQNIFRLYLFGHIC